MQLHLPPLPGNYFDKQFLPWTGQASAAAAEEAKLISCDMPQDMVDYVVGSVLKILCRRRVNEQILPREIKEDLDRRYGTTWQVVVTSGQFWAWFTHIAGSCLIFKCQRYCFLVWRTRSRPAAELK